MLRGITALGSSLNDGIQHGRDRGARGPDGGGNSA